MKKNKPYHVSDHKDHVHFSINAEHFCDGFNVKDIKC